jgi:hypothetical protein
MNRRKNLISHSLSIWLSWILGVLAIITGVAIMVIAFTAWGPVRGSLVSMSEGLRSANSAVGLIGEDFGTSSSLFSQVSNSIRDTRAVVHETWITVNSIRETTAEIRGVVLTVSESLENLPPTITSLLGRSYFSETVNGLNRTFYTSGEMIAQMEHLSATLEPMEPVLEEVADGVDSLANDLFSTEEAFGEANEHLERAAGALEKASQSSILPLIVAGTGLIPVLVGFYLIIQGIALRKLYYTRAEPDLDEMEEIDPGS